MSDTPDNIIETAPSPQLTKRQAYYAANKERENERCRAYCAANKEKIAAQQKQRRDRVKDEFRDRWYSSLKKHRENLKQEVLGHYSNGEIQCRHCGFNDIRALSIDHINGKGTSHRKETTKTGGVTFYRWLRQNGFPEGFQVLCMNCQFIKRAENGEESPGGHARTRFDYKANPGTEYQGVVRERSKLSVRLICKGKQLRLGVFKPEDEIEAAMNYDYHVIQLFGRNGRYLNFPEHDYSDFVPRKTLNYGVI